MPLTLPTPKHTQKFYLTFSQIPLDLILTSQSTAQDHEKPGSQMMKETVFMMPWNNPKTVPY